MKAWVVLSVLMSFPARANAQVLDWMQVVSTPQVEAATDGDYDPLWGLTVAGTTEGWVGTTPGGPSAQDAWIARHDRSGALLWRRQLVGASTQYTWGACTGADGGAWMTGVTYAALTGTHGGFTDPFVAKYDSNGSLVALRQFAGAGSDYSSGMFHDGASGVWLCGDTQSALFGSHAGSEDAWLLHLDSTGATLQALQFGTSARDSASAITAEPSGGFYVVGSTTGSLFAPSSGDYDPWLSRRAMDGSALWSVQLGTTNREIPRAVLADSGGVWWVVESLQFAGPNVGDSLQLRRHDGAGNLLWSQTIDSGVTESNSSLAIAGNGEVYLSYSTFETVGGMIGTIIRSYVRRYGALGQLLTSWETNHAPGAHERALFLVSDDAGGVFTGGDTVVSTGPFTNDANAWIARYFECRTVSYCTAGTSSGGCTPTLSSVGVPRASATSGFTLTASGVDGQRSGLFLYGVSGPEQLVWGNGGTSYSCVRSPLQRMTAMNSGGTSGACNGTLSQDWNAFRAANPSTLGAPFSVGDSVWVQAWFRDPPALQSTQRTQALAFSHCP